MNVILTFVSKYFLESIIVIAFGIISKVGLKYFSVERWATIKDMVLTAMLWAEEAYGIGNGQEKWTKAWQKIVELLKARGITIKDKEIPLVTDLMKSNIPEINSITYSALPPEASLNRDIFSSTPVYKTLLTNLRKKHLETKE